MHESQRSEDKVIIGDVKKVSREQAGHLFLVYVNHTISSWPVTGYDGIPVHQGNCGMVCLDPLFSYAAGAN